MRLSAALVCGLGLAMGCVVGAQATKRPMTFADLQAMKRVSDPQVSPSGKWVVFSVTDVSLEKNTKIDHLWIVPLDGSAKERPLVTSAENSATAVNAERFSPDGKWLMYAKPLSGRLWFAPFDDAKGTVGKEDVVTTFDGAEDAIWAPDSKHIVFSMEVYPECESKLPMGPKHDEEELMCDLGKEDEASHAVVKAQIFTTLLYRHWDAYMGAKRKHVFYLRVRRYDGDEASAMPHDTYSYPTDITPASVIGDHVAPTFSLGGPLGYAIAPDGKEVAYVVNLEKVPAESTNNDVFVWQVGTEPSSAKKVSTSPGSDDGPAYSPDGKWVAWRSQARDGFESDKFDLVVMDRGTGKIRDLTTSWDNWVDEFVWAGDRIFFTSGNHGEEEIFSVASSGGPIDVLWSEAKDDEKRQQNAEYGSLNIVRNGPFLAGTLVATKMSAELPTELVSMRLTRAAKSGARLTTADNGSLILQYGVAIGPKDVPATLVPEIQLTSFNAALLSQLDLSLMESFTFEGANAAKVEGFVIKPPNFDPAKKYPVKFVMHGGPQTALGDSWSYRWNMELLAADGYVVVAINRRGSTGYGQKFVDEVSGDWGGKAFTDLMKGLDYAEKTYPFIDKDRECALGASYGGFMANWVLTHTDRFKCIVTHDGMYNPQSAFGTTEELWFNEWEFRPAAASGVGVEQGKAAYPWDYFDKPAAMDPFRKWSPMQYIKNAKTPTLVIHGQKDYRLDVSEGFQLFTALQLLHVPSKMLYFVNEGHWVLKPKDSQLWYETVNDWCDRWTGTNKYAAVGPEVNPLAKVAVRKAK